MPQLSLNQKLALSKRPNCVTLFRNKVFVNAYNESAYILVQLLGKSLKPLFYCSKYPPYSLIVSVGLPVELLLKNFPDLVIKPFGYELVGEFDLSDYNRWFAGKGVVSPYCGVSAVTCSRV